MPTETQEQPSQRKERESWIIGLLKRKPGWRDTAVIVTAVAAVVGLALMVVVWFYGAPALWHWSTAPFSEGVSLGWLRIFPGILGLFFLLSLSLWLPLAPAMMFMDILQLKAEASDDALARRVDELDESLSVAERELSETDAAHLVPVIHYSRSQLMAYYKIGLTQVQRSFRYSVIAMWLGFLVILAGLAYQVLPLENVLPLHADRGIDITLAAIAGSVVIELIAALFLWVYRNSLSQLTYFYNRQLHIHNVLLCFRMASAMKEPDETVRVIIERVLESGAGPEQAELPSGKVLKTMFSPRKAG